MQRFEQLRRGVLLSKIGAVRAQTPSTYEHGKRSQVLSRLTARLVSNRGRSCAALRICPQRASSALLILPYQPPG
jgi:hypothetical protein